MIKIHLKLHLNIPSFNNTNQSHLIKDITELQNTFFQIEMFINEAFNIKTYCYTAREDLDFSNVYFAVNASSQNIKANRYFLCTDKQTFDNLPNRTIKCKGDCKKCSICYDSNYKGIIYCKQH